MNFYENLMNTAESCGLKTISDENCCKLLAWLYVLGGDYEAVRFNLKLNTDIKIAQHRLGLKGGSKPNTELYNQLRKYLKEVEPIVQSKAVACPSWCAEINRKYGLPFLKN